MRSEYKYLIPDDLLPTLREQIAPFVYLDPHGVGYEEVGYTVRSIYLDTADLRYYREKKAGIKVRRKLRVRGYNQYEAGNWLFLEIKRKVEGKVSKNRAPLAVEDLQALFDTGDIDHYIQTNEHYAHAREDARRFFFHVYRYGLRPTHMTVYEREAYLGRFDATFRLTFDRDLRGGFYPSLGNLYDEAGLRHVLPGHFVLEVKFNTRFPTWLRPILGQYDLRHRALSKYCTCAQAYEKQYDSKVTVMANATQVMPHPAKNQIPPLEVPLR